MKTGLSLSVVLAGGLAAPADAVTVTQYFNLANNGSGRTDIFIGNNSFAQYAYISTPSGGGTNTATFHQGSDSKPPVTENGGPLTTVSKGSLGPPDGKQVPLPDPSSVNSTDTVLIGKSDQFASDIRYLALKFPINGIKTVGNAFFDGQHKLVAVQYASTSAVPEPDTWVELLAGFALAGAAVRRRRQAMAA